MISFTSIHLYILCRFNYHYLLAIDRLFMCLSSEWVHFGDLCVLGMFRKCWNFLDCWNYWFVGIIGLNCWNNWFELLELLVFVGIVGLNYWNCWFELLE